MLKHWVTAENKSQNLLFFLYSMICDQIKQLHDNISWYFASFEWTTHTKMMENKFIILKNC